MKKVLFIGMNNSVGGIEIFIKNILFQYDTSKFHVDLIKYDNNLAFENELKEFGCSIFKLTSRSENPLLFYRDLFKFYQQHKEYDFVHNHLNSASCIGATVMAKFFGFKTIIHSHNEYKGGKFLTRLLVRINKPILNQVADIRLACSQKAGVSLFGKRPFKIIKNGIDAKKFAFSEEVRTSVRNHLGLKNEIVIGHIGGFKRQKNHEFIIKLLAKLIEQKNDYRLLLVGDGVLKKEMQDLAQQLEVMDKIIFLGYRDDTANLLSAMDIFVLPSIFEGLGIVLVEAQASGLPCIVSEHIPEEAFLSPLVKTASLRSYDNWIDCIRNQKLNVNRIQSFKLIEEKKYDNITVAKEIQNLYQCFDI